MGDVSSSAMKTIDIRAPIPDEVSQFDCADLRRSSSGMIPNPAFRDAQFVGNLTSIQESVMAWWLRNQAMVGSLVIAGEIGRCRTACSIWLSRSAQSRG